MSASELKPGEAQVRLRNARTEFGHDFCVIPKSDVYAADDEITALRAEVARLKSTGRVVADEPEYVAEVRESVAAIRHCKNDQLRHRFVDKILALLPAPREAEDNKQQCRLPRDLEPTDPQWLRRAVAGGEAWASDPDLDDITLPSDEQLKEWGVKVVGFRVTRPGDRYLWGNALRVDTSVCEGACKRLIVADAEADAESDDTAEYPPFDIEQCKRDNGAALKVGGFEANKGHAPIPVRVLSFGGYSGNGRSNNRLPVEFSGGTWGRVKIGNLANVGKVTLAGTPESDDPAAMLERLEHLRLNMIGARVHGQLIRQIDDILDAEHAAPEGD